MPCNYKKYPANWLSEIRPRILKRANYTCEFGSCDFEHGEIVFSVKQKGEPAEWFRDEHLARKKGPVKPVKVILTIAHLDHDEANQNISDDRLKAGCQICHLRYDAEEKEIRRMIKKIKQLRIKQFGSFSLK